METIIVSVDLISSFVYYLDTSVSLENTPLMNFVRNYVRDPSATFSSVVIEVSY